MLWSFPARKLGKIFNQGGSFLDPAAVLKPGVGSRRADRVRQKSGFTTRSMQRNRQPIIVDLAAGSDRLGQPVDRLPLASPAPLIRGVHVEVQSDFGSEFAPGFVHTVAGYRDA